MKKQLITVIAAFIGITLACTNIAADQHNTTTNFSPSQKQAIEKIIHDYLISHPEILLKASRVLQQKQAKQAQNKAISLIQSNINSIFNDPKSPTIGNPNGNIEIVEFFDYQCSHCKKMAPRIEQIVKENPEVKVIFKELPIFGNHSETAAKAALASTLEGKYYAFHKALLQVASPLTYDIIMKTAASKKVGLNRKKIEKLMKEDWITQQIKDNTALANKLELPGTPAFIVSNKAHSAFRLIFGETTTKNLERKITEVSSSPK